ncbi:16S rRNA (cytidine(1402)-2'-O)-methyltransferase [Usitatibacter palustris]|uniref:Ribosomal RNA small subunit methyltransferase I n=1 Tax=Usitatibacter palustris TaxID=2732487 RepID=A0A6M4H562_9PROT|nr:16S rRNA (cytidine(1402)-2'-O)-methyltransferase [Usitatibacter palustris]QJR13833.1 Ribosomal RNA small subunit methyltransferase I [Usitatibacter palustris]
MAKLYVVATPIGNLGDITARALETLRDVAVIAAEDTRNTKGLLNHFGIGTRLIALHAHNERNAARQVLELLAEGKDVALVTDAGTPAISDPGALLVAAAREAGYRVEPIPGASALTAALSASGLGFEGVVFAGFLPVKGTERREKLASLAQSPWAIVLFEAPHRVAKTLADLRTALGDRDVVVARELTKRFETITRVALADAAKWIAEDSDRERGEFVLVIEGRVPEVAAGPDPETVLKLLLAEKMPVKSAAAVGAKLTGAKKGDLYEMALRIAGKKSGP